MNLRKSTRSGWAPSTKIIDTADVSSSARIGPGSIVWHMAQVREGAVIGEGCVIGRGAYIGPEVQMGRNCKVQNYALVYEPARVGEGVFIGPAAVLTNDTYPRAVNPDGSTRTAKDWRPVGVNIGDGASVGAGAVCIAPVSVGAWAVVAAGAVVTRDVPSHGLVVGVPARQVGWVSHAGARLVAEKGRWRCPLTGRIYKVVGSAMTEVAPDE